MNAVSYVPKDKMLTALSKKIDENKEVLLDPLIDHVLCRIKPFVVSIFVLFSLIIILIIVVLFLVLRGAVLPKNS